MINLARHEPVLLLTRDGKEFCIAEADDLDKEVEMLRRAQCFSDSQKTGHTTKQSAWTR